MILPIHVNIRPPLLWLFDIWLDQGEMHPFFFQKLTYEGVSLAVLAVLGKEFFTITAKILVCSLLIFIVNKWTDM